MLTPEKCYVPNCNVQTQRNIKGSEARRCFCTTSFYFELTMYVKSVTALSLLRFFPQASEVRPRASPCARQRL